MKKRILATVLATAMSVMLMGTQVMAASTENVLGADDRAAGGTVTGNSDLLEPVYKLVVPTKLEFSVDAFQQGGQTQIYSEDFPIINKSNVAVKVDVDLTVAGADGANVTLKTSATDVTKVTDTSKVAYIAAAVPVGVTVVEGQAVNYEEGTKTFASITDANTGTTGVQGFNVLATTGANDTATEDAAKTLAALADNTVGTDYSATIKTISGSYSMKANILQSGTDQYKEYGLGAAATTITFALEKADYFDYYYEDVAVLEAKAFEKMAASKTGASVFRFMGTVNDKADWEAGDLTAKAVYNFIGLSNDNYTTALTDDAVAVGSSKAHALISSSAVTVSGTYYTGSTTAFITVLGATAGTNPTEVTIAKGSGTPAALTGATGGADTVSITKAQITTALGSATAGSYTVNFKYNGTKYTCTFTLS